MPRRSSLILAALTIATACSIDTTSGTDPAPRVEQVVLVSIDGLRGDALAEMPSLSALLPSAVWSDRARSVVPAITLPAHLSMLTGHDVTAHGVVSNTLDASMAFSLLFSGVSAVFDWIEGPSDAVVGASLLPAADVENARGLLSLRRIVPVGLDDAAIVDAALAVLSADDAPDALFVHLPAVDLAGHEHGWITSAGTLGAGYLAAVRNADAQLARLHTALAPAIADGRAALIVTSDHGGGHGAGCGGASAEREHCTAHPGDQLVPFVMLGGGASPGLLDGEPSILQVAPTIGALLGARVPEGMTPIGF